MNYETTSAFSLTVRVSDGTLWDDGLITVNLTDINEPPSGADASAFVDENSPVGTVVHTVSATDPDAGAVLTYSIIAGNTSSAFDINSTSGEISVSNATALDFETTPKFSLTVRVSDGSLSDDFLITVQLNDVNEAPEVSNATVPLAENTSNGTIVHNVTATDPDAGAVKSYSITAGNTDNAIIIHSSTGQITVNNVAALNYETTPVFNLTVRGSTVYPQRYFCNEGGLKRQHVVWRIRCRTGEDE